MTLRAFPVPTMKINLVTGRQEVVLQLQVHYAVLCERPNPLRPRPSEPTGCTLMESTVERLRSLQYIKRFIVGVNAVSVAEAHRLHGSDKLLLVSRVSNYTNSRYWKVEDVNDSNSHSGMSHSFCYSIRPNDEYIGSDYASIVQ